jgi:2,4-dienoyl-CoA reductase-like NADH-dependent reductase (Old Yellow Enzyme family)
MEEEPEMSKLFEPGEINGMQLQNRFVRSATWEAMADESGASTPELINLLVKLARGELGLIINSHAYVQKVGQAGVNVCQLSHAGFFGNTELTRQTPIAPSNVEGLAEGARKEMTKEDIGGVIEAFAAAAGRAKSAGFDGIQIHAGHGYLLSEFISPLFNYRTDEYGGPIENRARLALGKRLSGFN